MGSAQSMSQPETTSFKYKKNKIKNKKTHKTSKSSKYIHSQPQKFRYSLWE